MSAWQSSWSASELGPAGCVVLSSWEFWRVQRRFHTDAEKWEKKKIMGIMCDYMNGKIKNNPFNQSPSEIGLKLAVCLCCVTLSGRWCNKNWISTLNCMILVYGLKYFTLLTVSEHLHSNLFPTRAQSPPETDHVQFWFIQTKDQKTSREEKVPARSPVHCQDHTRMWLICF